MERRIHPGRKMRLVFIGLLVVGFSLCASLLLTHLAFQTTGTVDYATAMTVAAAIPLLVAPSAYVWIARLTWKLEQSNVELDRMAHSDVLTNIANRRYAMHWLRTAMEGEDKDAKAPGIMIAMADIDHFKRINDSYGHDAGDDCIVHVARTIETLVPHGWLVARMGGEEFLIAAKGADESDFGAAIEHIRRTLEQVPLITPQGRYGMTASFGYAKMMAGDTLDHTLRRTDSALYAAKDGGRNRTVAAAG